MTQKNIVIDYFKKNNNKPLHFKELASELNILVPNMRRILGEGTLKGIFTRISKGVYKLNNEDNNYIFTIHNEKDNELHMRTFNNKEDCRHWIINNLDLSKNWAFYKDGNYITK